MSATSFAPPPVLASGLPDLANLPAMDVVGRVDRLRDLLVAAHAGGGAPSLLVTNRTNLRYLTGFSGSAGRLLVTPDELVFVTDGRYATQAPQQLDAAGVPARIEILATVAEQDALLADAVAGAGIGRLGLEADDLSWAAALAAVETFAGVELEPTRGVVEELRIVKDEGEVARIEAAAMIADAALAQTRHRLLDGLTEAEFALELDTEIRRLGATGNSFPTIVGSGPNGALPHVSPGDRRIVEGDLVVLDFGAIVDGYCSDMTRTLAIGEPDALSARMLEVVLASQAAGVDAVRDGADAAQIDQTCRQVIDDAGWAEAFIHGTGHGVGLDIHEAPRVARTSEATVHTGYIVTVEPGVYLPDHGGVRIEDTVVVTPTGCRALTHTAKTTAP